jgi:hypothetical protein
VVYPRSTFLKYFVSGTKYSRLGLRWTAAPDIYEAEIRCNIAAFGPITAMHNAVQWGYEFGGLDPADVATMTSGLRYGRRVRIDTRPTLTVNFGVPVNQTLLYSAAQGDPLSYKLTSTSSAVFAGTWGDAPNKLMGAWQQVQGTRSPVIFIPAFTPGTPDSASLVGRNYVGFYGRMTEPTIQEINAVGTVAPVVQVVTTTFSYEL